MPTNDIVEHWRRLLGGGYLAKNNNLVTETIALLEKLPVTADDVRLPVDQPAILFFVFEVDPHIEKIRGYPAYINNKWSIGMYDVDRCFTTEAGAMGRLAVVKGGE